MHVRLTEPFDKQCSVALKLHFYIYIYIYIFAYNKWGGDSNSKSSLFEESGNTTELQDS